MRLAPLKHKGRFASGISSDSDGSPGGFPWSPGYDWRKKPASKPASSNGSTCAPSSSSGSRFTDSGGHGLSNPPRSSGSRSHLVQGSSGSSGSRQKFPCTTDYSQASPLGELYSDGKPRCHVVSGGESLAPMQGIAPTVELCPPVVSSKQLSWAKRCMQHIKTYGEEATQGQNHGRKTRVHRGRPGLAQSIAPVHHVSSHDRDWVSIFRGGVSESAREEIQAQEVERGTVDQLLRLRRVQQLWPGRYDHVEFHREALRHSGQLTLPRLQRSSQDHQHDHQSVAAASSSDADQVPRNRASTPLLLPLDASKTGASWERSNEPGIESTEGSGNLDIVSEGSSSEDSFGSLRSAGDRHGTNLKGSQRGSRSGSQSGALPGGAGLDSPFEDAVHSPRCGNSSKSTSRHSSQRSSRRSSSSGSQHDISMENPNLCGSGAAWEDIFDEKGDVISPRWSPSSGSSGQSGLRDQRMHSRSQSSALSSKRSSLVDEVPPTIPEERGINSQKRKGARSGGSGRASINNSRATTPGIATINEKQTIGAPASESENLDAAGAAGGASSTEKRWGDWRAFFTIEVLDCFAETYGRLPSAKDGTGVIMDIDNFAPTFVDITGLFMRRETFAEQARQAGVGILRVEGLVLASLHEFLELMRTTYRMIQESNPEAFWPREELDHIKIMYRSFAPNGGLKLARLFELLTELGHEDLIQDIDTAEKQKWIVNIVKEQIGAEGGTLNFLQFLKMYNVALLELQKEKRIASYERERKSQLDAKFTASEMDDLRELHMVFCTAERDAKSKGIMARLTLLLQECGVSPLSEKEVEIMKTVLQEHPVQDKGGPDPSFAVFVSWMSRLIKEDIGGIAMLLQKPETQTQRRDADAGLSAQVKKKEGQAANRKNLLKRKSFAQIMQLEEEEEEEKKQDLLHEVRHHDQKLRMRPGSTSKPMSDASATPKSGLCSHQQSRRGSSNAMTGLSSRKRSGQFSKQSFDSGDGGSDHGEEAMETGVLQLRGLPPDQAMLGRRVPRAISAEDSGDEGGDEVPREIRPPRNTTEPLAGSEGMAQVKRKVKERPDPVALVNAAIQSLKLASDETEVTDEVCGSNLPPPGA